MEINATFHPKFAPLFDPQWNFIILRGGRNSMKSWAAARAALIRGAQRPHRFLCCRELQNSIAESMHKLLCDQVETLQLAQFYKTQRDGINGINGTDFFYMGLRNDPQKVKSTEGVDVAIVEEAQSVSQESLDTLIPTIRKKGSQIWFIYNPRYDDDPIHVFANNPPPGTIVIDVSYEDAIEMGCFDEKQYAIMEHLKKTNPLMYEHVWLGKIVPALSTALWHWDDIDKTRVAIGKQPDLARVVVAIDPAVTANKRSDETGVVVVGRSTGKPRHYYVLQDVSGRYQPEGWAKAALDAYDACDADAIVCEVNQGGDLVAGTLRNYCQSVGRPLPRVIPVRATRGKVVRAEPVSALYAQGLVHHVGGFAELERQMLHFDPAGDHAKSPDRVDALVWGMTELAEAKMPMRIAEGALALAQSVRRR